MRCRVLSCLLLLASASLARSAAAAPKRWELEPTVGYAGTFTTGLSPYRMFVGLGVRANPAAALWLSGSLRSFLGSRAAGDGVAVNYRGSDRAYAAALDATWRFQLGRGFHFEPGAELGAAWVLGASYVTPVRISDRYLAVNVGPVLRFAVQAAGVAWGVEGAALYVPSYPAAPIARGAAVVCLPF